jgi:hypothetical protein
MTRKKFCAARACFSVATTALDLGPRRGEHFIVLVPRAKSGDERGNTETAEPFHDKPLSRKVFAAIRGCPRNCERRALSPKRPLGNWEGRIKATTREPGDLPARSPNRWTGRPYGAVFRSGDVNAGAKAVKDQSFSFTTFGAQV